MRDLYEIFSRLDALAGHPGAAILLAAVVACALAMFLVLLPLAGVLTYVERKLAARIQKRPGPNTADIRLFARTVPVGPRGTGLLARVGGVPLMPPGFLQWIVDGVKLLLKEDITPRDANRPLFKLAPYLSVAGTFTAFCAIPFSEDLAVSRLNIGVFFVLAITSLNVISILMAGWSSNNKWSLIGGMRAAAQILSYEIPVGLCVLAIAIWAGSMELGEIVRRQAGAGPGGVPSNLGIVHWNVLGSLGSVWDVGRAPIFLVLFVIYYVAAIAECNRTPFDLPEAESELVAGFHTEYSGMRFSFFFMGEYTEMLIISALAAILFLGGWYLPVGEGWLQSAVTSVFPAPLKEWVYPAASGAYHAIPGALVPDAGILGAVNGFSVSLAKGLILEGMKAPVSTWILNFVHASVFLAKCVLSLLFIMVLRWTLPRFRIDQMMNLCWRRFIPAAFALLLVIAWLAILDAGSPGSAPPVPVAGGTP